MPDDYLAFNSPRCDSAKAYTNALCSASGYMSIWQRIFNGYQWQGRSGPKDGNRAPNNLLGSDSGTLITGSPYHPQLKAYTMISAQRNVIAIELQQ
jgi:hypothetical protein